MVRLIFVMILMASMAQCKTSKKQDGLTPDKETLKMYKALKKGNKTMAKTMKSAADYRRELKLGR